MYEEKGKKNFLYKKKLVFIFIFWEPTSSTYLLFFLLNAGNPLLFYSFSVQEGVETVVLHVHMLTDFDESTI
jgi:hypothetical protein